jgi:hypothetical protein
MIDNPKFKCDICGGSHPTEAHESVEVAASSRDLASIDEETELSPEEFLESFKSVYRKDRRFTDPAEIALHFYFGYNSREQLEALIPFLESECLRKLDLLEEYKVVFRGDTLSENQDIDSQLKKREGMMTGAIRNKRVVFQSEEQRIKALGAFMMQIIKRYWGAKVYERENIAEGKLVKPVIFYGFDSFGNTPYTEIETEQIIDKYFEGDTDDIGEVYKNLHVFSLPHKIRTRPRERYPDSEITEDMNAVFPDVLSGKYKATAADRERLYKIIEHQGKPIDARDSTYDFQLLHYQSYINGLLFVDKILSDIEEYDKTSNK